jgi:long-subunit fatty acid transport protein
MWNDALTARVGTEFGILPMLKGRLGYAYDQKTSNLSYPTAFGTPPGATHIITAGVGLSFGPLKTNAAFAYRTGSATVTTDDLNADGVESCLPCGKVGDYSLTMMGFYADVSYDF